MAYIRWTNHPFDPTKNNTKEHVARSVAEVAVAYKQAVVEPRPNYGTKEWIEERQSADAQRVPTSADVDPNVKGGIEWGIKDRAQSGFSKVTIIKRTGCETTYFDAPPSDCPASIVARFRALTNLLDPDVALLQRERAKTAQYVQEQEEKKGLLRQIWSGK